MIDIEEYKDYQKDYQDVGEAVQDSIVICQPDKPIISPFFGQYQQSITLPELNFSLYKELFSQNQIEYKPESHYSPYQVLIQNATSLFEVMEAKVNIGHFQLTMLILNIDGPSPLSNSRLSDCGSFGKIYFKKVLEETIAIKSFQFNDQNKIKILEAAIKECSLLKISGLLKCAPTIGNGIGFDILVYDDCIQFSMEKGFKVTSLCKRDFDGLFDCLAKLHAFKIIHFDIKPPNISYSPSLKTIIFIDFGFSEIIREECGFKSQINFKGSPAFCGQQMLKLFTLQNYNEHIDVYYNDLESLKNTIECLRSNGQEQIPIKIDQVELFPEIVEPIEEFFLYAIKYAILREDRVRVSDLCNYQEGRLLKIYGKNILLFIKSLLPFKMAELLICLQLRPLNQLAEYSQIQNQLRGETERLHNPLGIMDQPLLALSSHFKQRYTREGQVIQTQNKDYNRHQQFLELRKFDPQSKQAEKYLNILIQTLRFDLRNIDFEFKLGIAAKFNSQIVIKATGQIKRQDTLKPIKQTFKYLLQYLISSSSREFKSRYLSVILTQMMLLDQSFTSYLPKIEVIGIEICNDEIDRIQFGIDLMKLVYLDSFIFFCEEEEANKQMTYKLCLIAKKIIYEAIERAKASMMEEERCVGEVLDQLWFKQRTKIMEYHDFQQITNKLKVISKKQRRYEIEYFAYNLYLQAYFCEGRLEQSLKILHDMKCFSKKIYNEGVFHFQYGLHFSYHLILTMGNVGELNFLSSSIRRAINCQIIFDRLKLNMAVLLVSDTMNLDLMHHYLKYMASLSIFTLFSVKISKEFASLIDKIFAQDTAFIKKNYYFIESIAKTLMNTHITSENLIKGFIDVQQIQNIMFKARIFRMLMSINEQFSNIYYKYVQSLSLSDEKPYERENPEFINKPKQVLSNLQYCLYAYCYWREKENYKQCKILLKRLYFFSNTLAIPKLKDYSIINSIIILDKENDFENLSHSIMLYYNEVKDTSSLVRYFNLEKTRIIHKTLQNFYLNKQWNLFYDFLKNLGEFISSCPLASYFHEWDISISYLFSRDKSILNEMQLDKTFGKITWKNRYLVYYYSLTLSIQYHSASQAYFLKKIAIWLPFLSHYAQENILQKYYLAYIRLRKLHKRKKHYISVRLSCRFAGDMQRNVISHLQKKQKNFKNSYKENNIDKIRKLKEKFSRKLSFS